MVGVDHPRASGTATLLAAWDTYARGSAGAAVHRLPGVAAAVFPTPPERAVYNNAVLADGLDAGARAVALDRMEAAYVAAGVTQFAAWTTEGDAAMRADLERRGYTVAERTRAMALQLSDLGLPAPDLDLAPPDWAEFLRVVEVPPDLLAGADHAAFDVLLARVDGEAVAGAMTYDHDGDCGVYTVGTLPHARRRGLGTALTALALRRARDRGCRTASLQATPEAERLYARLGFRDLGAILEYVPAGPGRPVTPPSGHAATGAGAAR